MAIQPIDLQTVYSQLSNVSKNVNGSQQANLAQAMQQQTNIQKNLENSTKVQQTKNEKTDTTSVDEKGHNNQEALNQNNKKKDKDDTDIDEHDQQKNCPPYIGHYIDITR